MRRFRALLLGPSWLWLLLLVGAPFAVVLLVSLGAPGEGVPPFAWPFAWAGGPRWLGTAGNFAAVLTDSLYRESFRTSLIVAGATASLCLLLAYPMALGIAAASPRRRDAWLFALLLPFWTGFLLRVGAWIGLLRDEGWVNAVLRRLGVIDAPLHLLYSDFAMLLGMVHSYLPFAVLPLFAALSRRDPALEEAAADLGASRWTVFRTVTLPLSLPGAAAAFLLVFIPAAGEFVIPELLGPPEAQLVGRVLWSEFFQNRDWPLASALAVLLLLLLIVPVLLFQRLESRE